MSNKPNFGDPFGRLRKHKRPAEERVGIVMESRFQLRVQDAQSRLSKLELKANLHAGKNGSPNRQLADELDEAEEQLAAARRDAEDHTEWFVAKAMAPRRFDGLAELHPPTPDQRKEARKESQTLRWNPETFFPALLAACVHVVTPLAEPNDDGETEVHTLLTEEFVKEMHEGGEDSQWNVGEINALVEAALKANHSGPQRVAFLGNA
jgi:hypothetical protein